MSLNWVMLSQDGQSPVPLPQEKMFFTQDAVKLVLDCNEDGYPGNTGGHWESKGTVHLSNQRIIFIAQHPTHEFQSLNIPILNLKQWKLEQPWFGANYIEGVVLPVPNGGLKKGKVVFTFIEGGATEFTTILHNLLERLSETNEIPSHYESLPSYAPPPPPLSSEQSQQPSSSSNSILPNELPPSYDEAQSSWR